MNDTTENLFKALESYVPPATVKHTIKLMYDSDGKILGCTFGDTHNMWIEISNEYWKSDAWYNTNLRIKDGKIIEIEPQHQTTLKLTYGDKWYVDKQDMLLCYGTKKVPDAQGWSKK